jgi:hypothetical protein
VAHAAQEMRSLQHETIWRVRGQLQCFARHQPGSDQAAVSAQLGEQ